MITMEAHGLKRLINKTDPKKLEASIGATMEQACERAFELAVGYCPKDTGELVESMFKECGKDSFSIGANARHAVFNEFGSIRTPIGDVKSPKAAKFVGVRPFIRPAIYQVKNEFPELFRKKYSSILEHG